MQSSIGHLGIKQSVIFDQKYIDMLFWSKIAPLYYYRDQDQKEADLIFETVEGIVPLEIKKGINPVSSSFNFRFLEKYKKPVLTGFVIACRDNIMPINDSVWYCPIAAI